MPTKISTRFCLFALSAILFAISIEAADIGPLYIKKETVNQFKSKVGEGNKTEADTDFKILRAIVMGTAAVVMLVGLIAMVVAWWVAAEVYLNCQQKMAICNEKLVMADALMQNRMFNEKVLERLSHEANFDVSKNAAELKQRVKNLDKTTKKTKKGEDQKDSE
ncbi:hypothetical protein M3Y97_00960100 [Aphelenchoides bicaudatus]|nr:hypothetical protein M3Y97_00960100 [Aphelenchoides bicaudatus]